MKKLSLGSITLTAALLLPLWFTGPAGAAVTGAPAHRAISAGPINVFSSSKDNKCKSRKKPPPPHHHRRPPHHEPPGGPFPK